MLSVSKIVSVRNFSLDKENETKTKQPDKTEIPKPTKQKPLPLHKTNKQNNKQTQPPHTHKPLQLITFMLLE